MRKKLSQERGLDHETGEGVMLFILPDQGSSGLLINREKGQVRQRVFLGTSKDGKTGLTLNDNTGTRRTWLGLKDGSPRLDIFDENGELVSDALREIVK